MKSSNGVTSRDLSTTFAFSVERIGFLGTDLSEGLFHGNLSAKKSYTEGHGTIVVASHERSFFVDRGLLVLQFLLQVD